jgi:hypothetical protein
VANVIDIEQPGRVPPLADRELRMSRAAGIPNCADFLRRKGEGVWQQAGAEMTMTVANRLLFAMFLMSEGRLGDEIAPEPLIRRAVGIPDLGRGGAE